MKLYFYCYLLLSLANLTTLVYSTATFDIVDRDLQLLSWSGSLVWSPKCHSPVVADRSFISCVLQQAEQTSFGVYIVCFVPRGRY